MSGPDLRSVHEERPRTADVRPPPTYLLQTFGSAARWIIRQYYDVAVHHGDLFPESGPVVVAANHTGFVDGPLMAIFAPRPVHAWTKREMFRGPMSGFLSASGQIAISREEVDPAAVRAALRVLRDGGPVGVFPEGTRGAGEMLRSESGAAYLALVTGAPVLPLVFLGTRLRGGSNSSIPPRGTHVVMQYGEPFTLGRIPWPRRQDVVRRASEEVRSAVAALLDQAMSRTGMTTPGEIPDPQTRKTQ